MLKKYEPYFTRAGRLPTPVGISNLPRAENATDVYHPRATRLNSRGFIASLYDTA